MPKLKTGKPKPGGRKAGTPNVITGESRRDRSPPPQLIEVPEGIQGAAGRGPIGARGPPCFKQKQECEEARGARR
jgi:hypothetical protein